MTDTRRQGRPPSEHWGWKPNPYVLRENSLAAAWKSRTKTLPEPARAAGTYGSKQHAYPHCLPAEFAKYNLLPDVREASEGGIASAGQLPKPAAVGYRRGPLWPGRWPEHLIKAVDNE